MADASLIDPKVAIGLVTTAFGVMGTVIGVLWKRIDTTNAKCVEDRDNQNKERIAENKAWFERFEGLYKEREAQNEEHRTQTREMFDQVVKLAEKSKDSEHATINALVETGRTTSEVARTMASINSTLTSLTGKIDELGRDIRLSHGPAKDPPRG